MGARLAELHPRDIARLRAELGEVIAARFAYPPFFDFRSSQMRTRPINEVKRQEIASFVQSVMLDPVARAEVESPETLRFFEALLLRYIELNGDLARGGVRWRLTSMRADARRAASEVQQKLVAYAGGTPGDFGAPRPMASWSASDRRKKPNWDRIQKNTELLQAAIGRPNGTAGSQGVSPSANGFGARASLAGGAGAAGRESWADAPMDGTGPLRAQRPGGSQSPYAGLESGSQSAMFAGSSDLIYSDQPTGHQPIVGLGNPAPRELPPDMLQMYSEYLRDLPSASSPTGARPAAPSSRDGDAGREPPSWPPPMGAVFPASPPGDGKNDAMVFDQLRHQLDAYIRLAARSYNVRVRGGDPAHAIDALRRSGHVDEADLRIAEGIFALADRVCQTGTATLDDYRHAFTLYLLYHRPRIGT